MFSSLVGVIRRIQYGQSEMRINSLETEILRIKEKIPTREEAEKLSKPLKLQRLKDEEFFFKG
jgi:hypothetical protein